MSLLSRGSIHQGHERFSGDSRGKQCSFMSLSALLTAQAISVDKLDSTIIDHVLVEGEKMYLNAYNNGLIPREELLSLNNLPTVASLSIEANISSVEVQNKNNLPVVVEPLRHKILLIYPLWWSPLRQKVKTRQKVNKNIFSHYYHNDTQTYK